MIVADAPYLEAAVKGALFIVTVAMGLAVFRIVRGPRNADRIIALDLLSILVVAFVALYAVHSNETVFLDVAIAYALVAFLGTVAFARYLEKTGGAKPTGRQGDGDE